MAECGHGIGPGSLRLLTVRGGRCIRLSVGALVVGVDFRFAVAVALLADSREGTHGNTAMQSAESIESLERRISLFLLCSEGQAVPIVKIRPVLAAVVLQDRGKTDAEVENKAVERDPTFVSHHTPDPFPTSLSTLL